MTDIHTQHHRHPLKRGPILLLTLIFACFTDPVLSQVKPYTLDLFTGIQTMGTSDRISSGAGWTTGGSMTRRVGGGIELFLDLAYDRMQLQQDTVLVEWDWAYWNERYIDFLLTGASAEEVDSINRALTVSFANAEATLHPSQWLNELRISGGISYTRTLPWNLSLSAAVSGGASLYERRLKMVENWNKEYSWRWSTAAYASGSLEGDEEARYEEFLRLLEEKPDVYRSEMDTVNNVEYQVFYTDIDYRISHLAPSRRGTRFYAAPALNLDWSVSRAVDLSLGWKALYYVDSPFLEDLVKASASSAHWFPYSSKQQFLLTLTFKY